MLQSSIAKMKSNASLIYNIFLVIGDFLALVAAFVGAYVLRVTLDARPLIESIPARTYLSIFLTLLPFWIIIFALLGLYNSNVYEKRFSELSRLFVGSFIGLLFVIGYDFVSNSPVFPARLVPVYGFLLAFIFLVGFRILARIIRVLLFRFKIGLTNILIIGDTPTSIEIIDNLYDSRHSGYRVVAHVGAERFSSHKVDNFGSFAEALDKLGAKQVNSIVQTELYAQNDKNNDILNYAQTHHIAYRFIPGNTELFVGKIDVELFRSSIPVIAVHQTALIGWGQVAKRIFDLVIALPLLVVLSPIILLIAVLIKLFGGGSVFFKQIRLTRYDQKFMVYKFRTQYAKYDGTTPEEAFAMMNKPELAKEYRQNGDYLAQDPRVTPIGGLLRKTSLDELPQLFNVVVGHLSLVGPRALVPEELDMYSKKHAILSVKSGLTGLAQVSGRRDISFEERRKLDVYYVQNWTFWLDIVILLKTIRVIFSGEGAK